MTVSIKRLCLALCTSLVGMLNVSCATNGTATTARLTTPNAATIIKVRAVLATAIGRPRFELGPEDLETSSSISVLPPPLGPLETRSLVVPKVFDIKVQNGACILVARDDGKVYSLDGVRCSIIGSG
jgi:hypothetical protein